MPSRWQPFPHQTHLRPKHRPASFRLYPIQRDCTGALVGDREQRWGIRRTHPHATGMTPQPVMLAITVDCDHDIVVRTAHIKRQNNFAGVSIIIVKRPSKWADVSLSFVYKKSVRSGPL
jgi:hypothetical protein